MTKHGSGGGDQTGQKQAKEQPPCPRPWPKVVLARSEGSPACGLVQAAIPSHLPDRTSPQNAAPSGFERPIIPQKPQEFKLSATAGNRKVVPLT